VRAFIDSFTFIEQVSREHSENKSLPLNGSISLVCEWLSLSSLYKLT